MELATDMANFITFAVGISTTVHVALTAYYFSRRAAEMV